MWDFQRENQLDNNRLLIARVCKMQFIWMLKLKVWDLKKNLPAYGSGD